MRRLLPPSGIALGLALVLFTAAGAGAHAAAIAGQRPGPCNAATLNGSYGLWFGGSGLGGPDPAPSATPEPLAGLEMLSFDGSGGVTGAEMINQAGSVARLATDGTYSVNADCSGTLAQTLTDGSAQSISFVIAASGKTMRLTSTDPGVIYDGVGYSIPPVCSTAGLDGGYGASGSGYLLAGSDGAVLPAPASEAAAGLFIYDGAGSFTAVVDVNSGGAVAEQTWSGSYTINADCTGSDTLSLPDGQTRHEAFIAVDGGRSLHVIETDSAGVVSDTRQQQVGGGGG